MKEKHGVKKDEESEDDEEVDEAKKRNLRCCRCR